MQLNNKNNGHIIIIDKIDPNQDIVVFSEYENTQMFIQNKKIVQKIINFPLKEFLYIDSDVNYLRLSCEKLIENGYEDYIIEEANDKNWLFSNRTNRITILKSLIFEHIKPLNIAGDLSDFGKLIERVKKQHFGFYSDNNIDNTFVIYLNDIDSSDAPIIAPFIDKSIWIED